MQLGLSDGTGGVANGLVGAGRVADEHLPVAGLVVLGDAVEGKLDFIDLIAGATRDVVDAIKLAVVISVDVEPGWGLNAEVQRFVRLLFIRCEDETNGTGGGAEGNINAG